MGLENKEFDKFVGEVCAQIKCKEVHSDIKEELDCHLEELKEEYISQGISSEEANRLAIAHMGDSENIGFEFDKVYRKRPEYKTLIIVSIFIVLGLYFQLVLGKSPTSSGTNYSLTNNVIFDLIGGVAGIAMYIFDYRKLEKYSMHLFIITNLFMVFSWISGHYVNGDILTVSLLGGTYNVAFISSILYIVSLCGVLPKLYSEEHGIIKIIAVYGLC